MAKMYSERLKQMNLKFKSQGIYLLDINSMLTVACKEKFFQLMQKKVLNEKTTFPYLQDKNQTVAKHFKAVNSPQAFVIWKNNTGKFTIKYSINIEESALEHKKANNYLEKAVDELLENKAVSNPNYSIFGLPHIFRGVYDKMR